MEAQDRWSARGQAAGCVHAWVDKLKKKRGGSHLKQHVFLTGSQIHFVLVIVDTDVDNVCQQFLVARNHLQLLVQALCRTKKAPRFSRLVGCIQDKKEVQKSI